MKGAPPKNWRWMPGMLDTNGKRVVDDPSIVPGSVFVVKSGGSMGRYAWHPHAVETRHLTPDLDDPATLGCLLALVREAWLDPLLYVSFVHGWRKQGWRVNPSETEETPSLVAIKRGLYPTETEALLAALEAAP